MKRRKLNAAHPILPTNDSLPALPQQNNEPSDGQEAASYLAVDQLKGKIALLRGKIQEMTCRNKQLVVALMKTLQCDGGGRRDDNEHGDISSSNNEKFKLQVVDAINKVSERKTRWSSKRTSMLVAQAVWAHEGFLPELLKLSRKYFRQKIFTTFNILREMDLAGGTLSYEGIDVLRRVELRGY